MQAECCVICLDALLEPCEILPCSHRNFHVPCLWTWLTENPVCPLCKTKIPRESFDSKEIDLSSLNQSLVTRPSRNTEPSTVIRPSPEDTTRHCAPPNRPNRYHNRRRRDSNDRNSTSEPHPIIRFRRGLYRHLQRSKSTSWGRVWPIPDPSMLPADFCNNYALFNRARAFVTRELRIFSFLFDPDCDEESATMAAPSDQLDIGRRTAPGRFHRRRTTNARFLTEYILLILKSMPFQDDHAKDLLAEYLGRDEANMFFHELKSWLLSPFDKLDDWDRVAQYPPPGHKGPVSRDSIIYPNIHLRGSPRRPGLSASAQRRALRIFRDRLSPSSEARERQLHDRRSRGDRGSSSPSSGRHGHRHHRNTNRHDRDDHKGDGFIPEHTRRTDSYRPSRND